MAWEGEVEGKQEGGTVSCVETEGVFACHMCGAVCLPARRRGREEGVRLGMWCS